MGANAFISFDPILPGDVGPGAVLDLVTLAPSSGLLDELTFVCRGSFLGTVSIEGSPDNHQWSILGQFTAALDADGQPGPSLGFSPLVVVETVRYLRTSFHGQVLTSVQITVAGEKNCGCPASSTTTGGSSEVIASHGQQARITGVTETVLPDCEWVVDFDDVTTGSIKARLAGLAHSSDGTTATFNLRIGGTIATADGTIRATFSTISVADVAIDNQGAAFTNPGGKQLVKICAQGGGASSDAVLRGMTVSAG